MGDTGANIHLKQSPIKPERVIEGHKRGIASACKSAAPISSCLLSSLLLNRLSTGLGNNLTPAISPVSLCIYAVVMQVLRIT